MNVPLKKRYNYCAVNNGNVAALNVNAKPTTINSTTIYTEMLYRNRENINENAEQAIRMDMGVGVSSGVGVGGGLGAITFGGTAIPNRVDPEKKSNAAICTMSTSMMPSAVKSVQTMRLQPHFIKHAGDVVQPIRSHVDDNPLPMNKTVKMHASPPRAKSSSSSAVITSSASNHSFTMTEQNVNRSSKTNESESTSPPIVRYTNKLLTENSIRLIELQSPGMTTHERVLNWRIADDFSDIDDGYDESLCTQSQPFRSERLQKRIYKQPVQTKPPKTTKLPELPLKKFKMTPWQAIENRSSESGSSSDIVERPAMIKLWTKNPIHLWKRQLLPLKVQVPETPTPTATTSGTPTPPAIVKAPSAIKLRIDYAKKPTPSLPPIVANFKVPDVPLDKNKSPMSTTNLNSTIYSNENTTESVAYLPDNGDDQASTTSSTHEIAELTKEQTTREEFYKYLGIDTNPCHEKLSPGSSTGDTITSSQMRRSLRVKIQQNIVNNLAKTRAEVGKVKNGQKSDPNRTPTAGNATWSPSIHSSSESKASQTRTVLSTHSSLKRNASPNNCETSSSKLLKISYMKCDEKKAPVEPVPYKSICLMTRNATQMNNSAPATNPSSHIFVRHSYAGSESSANAKASFTYRAKVLASATNQRPTTADKCADKVTEPTPSILSDVKVENDDNEVKVIRPLHRATTPKQKHLLRKAIHFTEIFKRYQRCLRQGIALKTQLQHTMRKRPARRQPSNKVNQTSTNISTNKECESSSSHPSPIVAPEATVTSNMVLEHTQAQAHYRDDDAVDVKENVIDTKEDLPPDVIAAIIGLPSTSTKQNATTNPYEEFAFSPTSITHSNASTDSAIVVSNAGNDCMSMLVTAVGQSTATPTPDAIPSNKCHIEQITSSAKPTLRNPLNPLNGCVHAILIHRITPHMQCVVVVQEATVSYWRMASNYLSIFGVSPVWEMVGEIQRLRIDTEIASMHQHRLIGDIGQYPAYVELRSRESPPNEDRQSCLSFVYANIYALRLQSNGERKLTVESVNLDSVKGYTSSINFIGIRHTSHIIMYWTEQTVTRTRSGMCKYIFKVPERNSVESILDFPPSQHVIKSLSQLTGFGNRYEIVGCGERVVSVWDHRSGNLLMNFEIDLPSLGTSLGCLCINYDSDEYLLLIQLYEIEDNTKYQQLKLIAVHTTNAFSWRTLHSHNIPTYFGRIQSTQIGNDTLTISFTNGNALLLNLFTPQVIYLRDEINRNPMQEAIAAPDVTCDDKVNNSNTPNTSVECQTFVQSDGRIVHVSSDYVTIKSGWEYFIQKE